MVYEKQFGKELEKSVSKFPSVFLKPIKSKAIECMCFFRA